VPHWSGYGRGQVLAGDVGAVGDDNRIESAAVVEGHQSGAIARRAGIICSGCRATPDITSVIDATSLIG
jgi:hypothetical protein